MNKDNVTNVTNVVNEEGKVTKEVVIVDSCCGTGKTSWAIQKMNENKDDKFIYITPFLDEVDRVVEECSDRYFYQPDIRFGKGSKREHFKKLLRQRSNIASTHSLFQQIDKETIDLIKENKYTLILDEVMDVVVTLDATKHDREDLIKYTTTDEKGRLRWTVEGYNGKFNSYYDAITNGEVYKHRDKFLMWTFPSYVFDKFKEVYIMTYMFDGQTQRYYYDLNNIKYTYKSVGMVNGRYELIEYCDIDKGIYRDLLKICDNEKLNRIGKKIDRFEPLSKGWFEKNEKGDQLDVLKRNFYNFFKNVTKTKASENGWSVFKDYQKQCKGDGYAKGFLAFNIRSTNQYRSKTAFAYGINLFMKPTTKSFFTDRGVEVSEDKWALSELIQFMFRGCIRDKKEMHIYIPSQRMRDLLCDWLEIPHIK